jgi:hypothetical protein
MIAISKHIPMFVECDEWEREKKYIVEDMNDLMKLPWVSSWAKEEGFHRFSIAGHSLMCELNEGRKWWVVGNFNDAEVMAKHLPKWEPVES